MKIRIEIEDNLTEEEIIIRSGSLNAKVQMIQKAIAEAWTKSRRCHSFKGDTEYLSAACRDSDFLRQKMERYMLIRGKRPTRLSTACMNWKRLFPDIL